MLIGLRVPLNLNKPNKNYYEPKNVYEIKCVYTQTKYNKINGKQYTHAVGGAVEFRKNKNIDKQQ